MTDISMVMTQSTGFQEMLVMQSSTVCALWGHLQNAIDSKWLVKIAFGILSLTCSFRLLNYCLKLELWKSIQAVFSLQVEV